MSGESIPDFKSDAEWLAYWSERRPPLTETQRRRISDLLAAGMRRRPQGGRQ